ncbi:GNAT family N-acetyltransferase [Luteipulveratus halotolerans]|uniref:N-acetyltransferase domain-containing protein n=1 Tax=Luteipulveratus halotolerans TaxID=1631356 RepID=A0A0L6CGJ0_9MICO|nr:GNAT family protein [Luteipulveratus halotolerans]KNX36922.1 hypothetical protein VV01_06775 [Luteipulveratus halotolerans]
MTEWSTDAARSYAAGLLVGDRVELRALREGELEVLDGWWNEPAEMVLQNAVIRPQPRGSMTETLTRWHANEGDVGFAVVERSSGELAGSAVLFGSMLPMRSATYAVQLGPGYQGRGLGPEVTRMMLRYGFDQMGLHRIQLAVWAYNGRAIAAYERAGFVVEGRRRDAVFHGGQFHDEVLMAVLEPEWRARQA